MIRRFFLLILLVFGLTGCSSSRNAPIVWYWDNEIIESLGSLKDYCVYDFAVPFKAVMDDEEAVLAHYKILLPPKKEMKKILYSANDKRCFLYSKNRGIAIIQDIHHHHQDQINGLQEISKDTVEDELFTIEDSCKTKVKVLNGKKHYLYVDNEIRIIMFNLRENDYREFVKFPLENLIIKRRGEVRKRCVF